MERINGLMTIGVIMVFAGLVGFAIPVFTTQSTETVAKIGDLKLQSTEDTSHRIPQFVSGGVLVLGLVLIGTGLGRKR
jgi:ABC-type nickel/cobalt efflux system permease component RcnA